MVEAISRFSSLSSTTSSFFPEKSGPFSAAADASSAPKGFANTLRSSDIKSGFAQKAVTPAAFASVSISVQS